MLFVICSGMHEGEHRRNAMADLDLFRRRYERGLMGKPSFSRPEGLSDGTFWKEVGLLWDDIREMSQTQLRRKINTILAEMNDLQSVCAPDPGEGDEAWSDEEWEEYYTVAVADWVDHLLDRRDRKGLSKPAQKELNRLRKQHEHLVREMERLRMRKSVYEFVQTINGGVPAWDEARRILGDDYDIPERVPPISGYYAPEYAEDAKTILDDNPHINSFTKLAAHMGETGGSRVDTIKRNIGYNDLPLEEKTFGRFKEILYTALQKLNGEE